MMRWIIILFSLVVIFLWNIFLYYVSEDYRFFLKSLKYSDKVVYTKEDIDVNDKASNNCDKVDPYDWKDVSIWEEEIKNNWSIWFSELSDFKENKEEEKLKIEEERWKIKPKPRLLLSEVYKDILQDFKKYELEKLEIHTSLFDLTTEYPDNYFEYSSWDITLYFFQTKDYKWVLDIFNALSYDLPFTINKANNFFWKSFYINLEKDYEDEYIRIVTVYKKKTFWLKIDKRYYDDVKKILEKNKKR